MFGFFKYSPTISTNELKKIMKKKIHLIDVRSNTEYLRGHIASAKNIPLANIDQLPISNEKEIYVICQSGIRSKKAARILKKKGYDVINVQGGMNQWVGPIKRGCTNVSIDIY